jgi:hypothetical protein
MFSRASRERRLGVSLDGVVRDPLLQFVATGTVIFLVHTAVARRRPAEPVDDSRHIVVDAAFVASVNGAFERSTGHEVEPTDRRRLVDQAIDEEILFREAKAMHLDENDSIVRRRLVQKAEFLIDDVKPVAEPTESELGDYLAAHADSFRAPLQVSFHQLFFSRDRRGAAAELDAHSAFASVTSKPGTHVAADVFLGGDSFRDRSERDIDGLFGQGAGRAIAAIPVGEWGPPFSSAYGVHIVQVDSRRESEVAPLARVRGQVRQAIVDERRDENRRTARAALRAAYRIEDRLGLTAEPVAHAMNDIRP